MGDGFSPPITIMILPTGEHLSELGKVVGPTRTQELFSLGHQSGPMELKTNKPIDGNKTILGETVILIVLQLPQQRTKLEIS